MWKSGMKLKNIKVVTECGMLLAVAMALSWFKLYQLPSGGSVSLATLPLFIIAARHGAVTGVVCGMLMGLLSLIRQPFIVHPLQFVLDYPLAYGAMGLAGIIKWTGGIRVAVAVSLSYLVRLHFHVITGALFFITDAENMTAALIGSYIYNLSFLVPETLICVGFGVFIAMKHKSLIDQNE